MSTESPAANPNLVSIICRTLGRPELQQALQSIAAQTYPDIEIILVDASGSNALNFEAAAGDRSVALITTGKTLSRSQAANAGLDAAGGKFLQFLDDDDWIAADHISQLVDVLQSNSGIGAAYSSTQKTNAAGEPLDYVFNEDFDPILLMRDNYIPIHAILFDSALLGHGCRFDETFDIYEDWDFWLQLGQQTRFQHIDTLTAFYREGGDSDTAVDDVRLRYQPDSDLGKSRAAIFEKWLPKWTGQQINTLIGQLDQSVLLCEQNAEIHRELKRNAELRHEVEKRGMQINEFNMQINELGLQIADTKSALEQLQTHSNQQAQHVSDLEQRLNSIYNSTSWKLMGPVRRAGRALSSHKSQDSDK